MAELTFIPLTSHLRLYYSTKIRYDAKISAELVLFNGIISKMSA